MEPMRQNVNGDDFSHLKLNNNIHELVKDLINNPLLSNQRYVANHTLKKLMWLIRLGETKNTRMDQVIYYVYKTDKNMEEHAPKINKTDILSIEGHQVIDITKYDEFNQD